MTRFEEVARLKELEKKATPAPWNLDMQFDPQDVLRNVKLETALRNAAPWLLEVVGCFQPGDDEILELFETYLAAHRPGGHLIEDGPTTADGIDCIRRLRRAMEIMEGQE